jgi:hypothetical protein
VLHPRRLGFFRATEVNASFAKSGALVEADGYKIHTSRRDAPGMAEVHRSRYRRDVHSRRYRDDRHRR